MSDVPAPAKVKAKNIKTQKTAGQKRIFNTRTTILGQNYLAQSGKGERFLGPFGRYPIPACAWQRLKPLHPLQEGLLWSVYQSTIEAVAQAQLLATLGNYRLSD